MITSYPVSPQPYDRGPSGIMIDGVVYQLGGQPPLVQSHGWGNMLWFFWRH